MNKRNKEFIKIIFNDIKMKLEKIIIFIFYLIFLIISILSVFKIISINILFWYIGGITSILVIGIFCIFLTDFINYIKNCWDKSNI